MELVTRTGRRKAYRSDAGAVRSKRVSRKDHSGRMTVKPEERFNHAQGQKLFRLPWRNDRFTMASRKNCWVGRRRSPRHCMIVERETPTKTQARPYA